MTATTNPIADVSSGFPWNLDPDVVPVVLIPAILPPAVLNAMSQPVVHNYYPVARKCPTNYLLFSDTTGLVVGPHRRAYRLHVTPHWFFNMMSIIFSALSL